MAYLTCPFCGFEFEKEDTLCAHGCPLGAACGLSRCPSCDYEFPEKPRGVRWLRRLFGSRRPGFTEHFEGARTLRDLKRGEQATVLCLGGRKPSRHNALAVFGLVPGAEITLLQQRPACVIRVGQTELALDAEIAYEIVVGAGSEGGR